MRAEGVTAGYGGDPVIHAVSVRAEPREVAFPILFLACDESSYITGATLMVDAGKSIL